MASIHSLLDRYDVANDDLNQVESRLRGSCNRSQSTRHHVRQLPSSQCQPHMHTNHRRLIDISVSSVRASERANLALTSLVPTSLSRSITNSYHAPFVDQHEIYTGCHSRISTYNAFRSIWLRSSRSYTNTRIIVISSNKRNGAIVPIGLAHQSMDAKICPFEYMPLEPP